MTTQIFDAKTPETLRYGYADAALGTILAANGTGSGGIGSGRIRSCEAARAASGR